MTGKLRVHLSMLHVMHMLVHLSCAAQTRQNALTSRLEHDEHAGTYIVHSA